jgi:hypothetical protein
MHHVFVVHHEHQFSEDRESVKLIGVYATRNDAEQAIERLKQQPGFRELPEGFSIDRYEVGKDHWAEGFVTDLGDE